MKRIRALAVSTLAVSILLPACGGGGGASSPTGNPSGSANPELAAARKAFCRDLVAVGGGAVTRPPAIARLLPHLRKDAASYRQAGDPADAARVLAFASALARVRAAQLGHEDPTKANALVQRAAANLPNCTP
ncbi:MAG: hypothetical protein M3Q23_12145 [Actinomycetota bacterium]|nr:hypothetical protein [Actinomycetota bacterium]